MPNSEVKRRSADGSVGSPYVRVNRQHQINQKRPCRKTGLVLSGSLPDGGSALSSLQDAPIHPQYKSTSLPNTEMLANYCRIEYQESSHDPLPKTPEYLGIDHAHIVCAETNNNY